MKTPEDVTVRRDDLLVVLDALVTMSIVLDASGTFLRLEERAAIDRLRAKVVEA